MCHLLRLVFELKAQEFHVLLEVFAVRVQCAKSRAVRWSVGRWRSWLHGLGFWGTRFARGGGEEGCSRTDGWHGLLFADALGVEEQDRSGYLRGLHRF